MAEQAVGERLPAGTLAVLALTAFAAVTTEILPVGLLPSISASLGTSESRVGLLVSAYAVVVALFSVPLTALTVRWPRRRVLCGVMIAYAVSNVVMAVSGTYGVALGARLFGGLAHAAFFSAVYAAAAAVAPRARTGRAMAYVGAGTAAALTVGVPVGAALGATIGWRWGFAGCAALMLVLAGAVLLVLPAGEPAPGSRAPSSVLRAARQRSLLLVAGVGVVLTLGHYTLYTYIAPLTRQAGVGNAEVSLVLFGYGAAGILGLVVSGVVVDRHPTNALWAVTALTTTCLLVLGLSDATTPTVVAIVFWGLAFGTLPTLLQAVALRTVPHSPDAAPAVVNMTFNIGIAGGALLGSRELLVAPPTTLALTGAVLAGCSLLLQIWRRVVIVR
jgi:DHA1 family inner membrane transport protein